MIWIVKMRIPESTLDFETLISGPSMLNPNQGFGCESTLNSNQRWTRIFPSL